MARNEGLYLLRERIQSRTARVGVVGLGYVGLPLAIAIHRAGFPTTGFDIDDEKAECLAKGGSYLNTVPPGQVARMVAEGAFEPTSDFRRLGAMDIVLICVPTPLNQKREPDLSHVLETVRAVVAHIQGVQLIVLESTTYPGTTKELVRPIFEAAGLQIDFNVFLAYSPERADPANEFYDLANTPKIIGADDPKSGDLAEDFYEAIVAKIVRVSCSKIAEAAKITENIFRSVNVALVNELKIVFDAMGIDVWEVIEAASTKPFGFMPFYPGPGLGGHCIPIDPFYLSWKAREHGAESRFIELAGEINVSMPEYVVERVISGLAAKLGRGLAGASVLLVGMGYKRNVGDIRESPSLRLTSLLEQQGAHVEYHDPLVPSINSTQASPELGGRASVELDPGLISADAVVIATDHDCIDYKLIADRAQLIVDTRNAFVRRGITSTAIIKA